MPLTARNSTRRRKKIPDEKLPARPGDCASAQVMLPSPAKTQQREHGAAGGGSTGAEEERSRRMSTRSTSAAASSSPPGSSGSSRGAPASEEASPDSKCPICLDRFNNLAYLDRCLHRFCFPCIQEWSHNKAECPLCKQPFGSILHSIRAEDDFQEYTLLPPPANGAASVTMVAAMASAARSNHQMRLMLRRHRMPNEEDGPARGRGRERAGRGGGGGGGGAENAGVWECYLHGSHLPPPPPPPPLPVPVPTSAAEEGRSQGERRAGGELDPVESGLIFEGLMGLEGTGAYVHPRPRSTQRLMVRLTARLRLQREGGAVRRLRERETVAFRRALYRNGVWVRGVAGVHGNEPQNDITAESFRQNPGQLARLCPWLQRELTALYGEQGSLVDVVHRIILARVARHGLADVGTMDEELQPFVMFRTDHFLHELISFARSPLSLDQYDLQAVYEPPAAGYDPERTDDSSDGDSVITISEGEEEEEEEERGRRRRRPESDPGGAAGWDETPGPSYAGEEPAGLIPPLASPGNEGPAETPEEDCMIVGYKKPMAERTPELVQLSSDTEEEEEEKKEEKEKKKKKKEEEEPPLLATIPPSTSTAFREEPQDTVRSPGEEDGRRSSWTASSGQSQDSVRVCTPPPPPAPPPARRRRDRKRPCREASREQRWRRRRRREQSRDRLRRSGSCLDARRPVDPAGRRRRSHSPPRLRSSSESSSPLPPSLQDSDWEHRCSSTASTSTSSSSSSSSSFQCSSPPPPPPPPASPGLRPDHHGDKPGGKRKYKSRHLDHENQDPSWRPAGRRGADRRKRRREDGSCNGESSSRRRREERSPSVEIIYEGTVGAGGRNAAAARKRRRARRSQQDSPPVVITLDSDSSLDNPEVDGVPELVPLASYSSGAVERDVGELPTDILDRGSEGSEAEPAGRPAPPVAVDDSEQEVDVEGSGGEGGRPIPAAARSEADLTPDARLLASVLDDLKGLATHKPANAEHGGPSGAARVRGHPEVGQDPRHPPRHASFSLPPLLQWPKPQSLQPLGRHTPPPLKHKDAKEAGSPRPNAAATAPPPAAPLIPALTTLKDFLESTSKSGVHFSSSATSINVYSIRLNGSDAPPPPPPPLHSTPEARWPPDLGPACRWSTDTAGPSASTSRPSTHPPASSLHDGTQ